MSRMLKEALAAPDCVANQFAGDGAEIRALAALLRRRRTVRIALVGIIDEQGVGDGAPHGRRSSRSGLARSR